MKLIFVDESKNDPDYPHYHLGAICIDDSALLEIETQINAIAAEAFGTAELRLVVLISGGVGSRQKLGMR